MHDRFNPATYMVIDRVTGEEVDVSIFIEDARQAGWEKAYADLLCQYIGCGGAQTSSLLAWLIKNRQKNNLILASQREMAALSKVSMTVVVKVIAELTNNGLIRQVRSGCYMLSPKMLRNGDTAKGAMMLKLWTDK